MTFTFLETSLIALASFGLGAAGAYLWIARENWKRFAEEDEITYAGGAADRGME